MRRRSATALSQGCFERGLTPDIVQVGNEISAGLLWPGGKWDQFDQLSALVRAGIRAVREAAPSAQVMLHLALGGQKDRSRWKLEVRAIDRGPSLAPMHKTLHAFANDIHDHVALW